jgi:dihydroxyacid dehydratase/phosphogluconate dehydratase
MTGTLAFPVGNLAPKGSVVKSTAIAPDVLDADGVFRMQGRARVFTSEAAAVAAVKSTGPEAVAPGDIVVLAGCGPMGTGMEETYQLTSALTHVPWGKHVAVLTDARFSGVSTGACVGHVSPEALAGGPIGKLLDGDLVRIAIDRRTLGASIDLVGHDGDERDEVWGRSELERRAMRPDMRPDPRLPADTRLWAALQDASGGTWGGCVYDVDAILEALESENGAHKGGT